MATKETSTRALTGKRVMNLGVSQCNLTLVLADGWTGQGSWQPLQAGSVAGVYSENYFDLSGYKKVPFPCGMSSLNCPTYFLPSVQILFPFP